MRARFDPPTGSPTNPQGEFLEQFIGRVGIADRAEQVAPHRPAVAVQAVPDLDPAVQLVVELVAELAQESGMPQRVVPARLRERAQARRARELAAQGSSSTSPAAMRGGSS